MNDVLNPQSAEKTQLGMGELFAILQSGTNTPEEGATWAFLEVQPDTVITEMKFTFARNNQEVTVTRYNITNQGVLLIPPVYQGKRGKWTSISLSAGQINCYGIDPIG